MTPTAGRTSAPASGDAHAGGGLGLDFDDVRRLLPHREPFVLVDRVLSVDPDRIVCVKNVTGAEPIFASHFPGHAIFPGVLTLEVMAQAALLLFLVGRRAPQPDGTRYVLAAARARWLRPVRPGDRMIVTVVVEKATAAGALVAGEAAVEGRAVARATLTVGRAAVAGGLSSAGESE
jgi:3-hydroxyacyl-[acyl-carrier-protein] dehydratase